MSKNIKINNVNSKYYCFTHNNYTDTSFKHLETLFLSGKLCYLIYGKEIGEKGTPHLQGYVEFKIATRHTTVVKFFGKGYHLEVRKGTQEEAHKYCRKGSQTHQDWYDLDPTTNKPYRWTHSTYGLNACVTEMGELTKTMAKGTRTDIIKIKQSVEKGGIRSLFDNDHVTLTQIQMAERYLSHSEKPRDFAPKFYYISGKSGYGKTTLAYSQAKQLGYKDDEIYTKSEGSKWWQSYDAHKVVILDDFRDSWMPLTEFLSLFSSKPKSVEYKGGSRQLKPEVIFLTSIKHPNELYANCAGDPQIQVMRRIDRLTVLTQPNYDLVKATKELDDKNAKYDIINSGGGKQVYQFNHQSLIDDKLEQLVIVPPREAQKPLRVKTLKDDEPTPPSLLFKWD